MLCKMVKKGVLGAALGAGALALLFGTAAPSYVKTAFHKIRHSARDSVGVQFRIDGGPAIVDFQSFLEDLDAAVGAVVAGGPAFTAFASAVLGPSPSPSEQAALLSEVQAWYLRGVGGYQRKQF